MLRPIGRGLAGFTLLVISLIAAGGVMAAVTKTSPRGAMIEVGEGRRLRLVCEGPASARPVVWLEAGAFGFAADWGATQDALGQAGWRSCAYDRAGMGYSDPARRPPDGEAIVADFEKLIAASGEAGPFILVGHSMAGLRLRQFAGRNPRQVAGLVLVDASTPEAAELAQARPFIRAFSVASDWAARGAALGLFKPLAYVGLGDKIGLPPAARSEKRWAFANAGHNRAAAAEVGLWPLAAGQAAAQPAYDPAWPVAVVTAGAAKGREQWKALQAQPARDSRHGYVDNVAAASHTTLLGQRFAAHIVRAVSFVATAGR